MNERPVAGDRLDPDRAATDVIRLQDRVNILEVKVQSLDLGHRRARAFGPALLIVLSTFTPLVAVTPRNDPQQTSTLWQAVRGGTADGGLSSIWFIAIATLLLAAGASGFAFLERQPPRGLVLFVKVAAAVLIVALIVLVIALAGQGGKSTAVSGLQTATVLAIAAACWLLASSTSAGE